MSAEPLFELLRVFVLLLVAVSAAGVTLTREPLLQTISVSLYGLLLALMFFVYQAPDVALSQLTVGALALPLMILLTLAKVSKREAETSRREGRR